MRIAELLREDAPATPTPPATPPTARVPWASNRFLKEFAAEKNYPGFLKNFEKFLKHYETSNALFNTKDGPLTRASDEGISPPVRRCHIKQGKIILVYQLTSTTIRLLSVGPHDIIEGKKLSRLITYIKSLVDSDFHPIENPIPSAATGTTTPPADVKSATPEPVVPTPEPVVIPEPEPEPESPKKPKPSGKLSDKEIADIKDMIIYLMTDKNEGVPIIRKILSGDIEEFMEWVRPTVGLPVDDTSRDRWIKSIFNNLPGMQQMARELLWIARQK